MRGSSRNIPVPNDGRHPPHAKQGSPKVHLHRINTALRKAETAAQGAVISGEASGKSAQSTALLRVHGPARWVARSEALVAGLNLNDDDGADVDSDDVRLKPQAAPVSLHYHKAMPGDVVRSCPLPPCSGGKKSGYSAISGVTMRSELFDGLLMPATPANVFRCTRHGPSSTIALL